MADAAQIAELDRLGPVLVALGHQRVNLTYQRDHRGSDRGYYYVDGRDADGRYFAGMGSTPSEALASAQRRSEAA